MNAMKKDLMSVEFHCVEMRYKQLRASRRGHLNRLVESIEQSGQLMPVVLVPKADQQWILIDGYLRVQALKRLGKDLVQSEIWNCSTTEALLGLLKEQASTHLRPIEEALWLQEIHSQGELSQHEIALRLGRDPSWVNRRLLLLNGLPDAVLTAILKEKISLWVATRILVPLARANAAHVQSLLGYLVQEKRSSREVQSFYVHYQCASCTEREKMINDPGLFFKTQAWLHSQKATHQLQQGPEGQWRDHCLLMRSSLKKIISLRPMLFIPLVPMAERHELLNLLNHVHSQLNKFASELKEMVS
jgi:ParB/RepB/Spo0J family partition protein